MVIWIPTKIEMIVAKAISHLSRQLNHNLPVTVWVTM